MVNVKPRTSNPISSRDRVTGVRRASSVVEGKPRHDFSACIACAACAAACDANAIRIFIDEDEGLLVWTLDLFDCTQCGRCVPACPTGAMDVIEGADFADEPELPKRCLFAGGVRIVRALLRHEQGDSIRERPARAGGARRRRPRPRAHGHLPRLQAHARRQSRRPPRGDEAAPVGRAS